ncbi:MAG: hypothetical protein WB608_19655 [Terracidiphilus sp.]
MITVRNAVTIELILSLTYLVPLRSQIQTAAANTTTSAASPTQTDQAPDEMTKKMTDLVHAGKYSEAQKLTEGLLIAYPNDQRLVKAKALIEKLLQSGGSPSSSEPTQSAGKANAEQLMGMDKVEYNALIELARQAKQSTDLAEQTKLLKQFMDQSGAFLQKHPGHILLWELRAQMAMSMNDPMAGYEAGEKILASGGAESNDTALQQLLGQLKNKGWLNQREAESQARSLDDARHAEEARQDHDRFTFPVAHASGLHYTYGHLTITPNDATYISPDENIHFLKKDIHEMKVLCVGNSAFGGGGGCGFYFIPTDGRKFYFLAVTEAGVANKTIASNVVLPPSVLGNAAVARWHFIKIDNKTLGPSAETAPEQAPAAGGQTAPEFGAPAERPSVRFDNSNPQPDSQRAATARVSNPLTAAPTVQAESSTINPAPSQQENSAGSTTAILHLYRLSHITGAFSQYEIEIDGRRLAKIANAQSVRLDLSPGKHNINATYRAVKSDHPVYDLNMESGKEYWIRVDLSDGFIVHMRLAVVPEAEAREESGKLKEIATGDLPSK